MTNPNDPNNPFGGQDNNPFGGGYGTNGNNTNNPNPADSTGSTSYGQSGQNGYGQSGSSSYGQSGYGDSSYSQGGFGQTGSTPNSGFGDSGYGQPGAGFDTYGQGQDGYGQNAYAPGPGFQHPENDPNSESGRPLQIGPGPLPVVEPIPFAFKRLFSKNWHVYIGFTVLMLIGLVVAMMLTLVPVMMELANNPAAAEDPNFNPIAENPLSFILFYVLVFVIGMVMTIVLYNTALRDSRGEEPSWGNLFKNVPWGQAILVHILVGLICGVVAFVLMLLSVLLGLIHPALVFLGFLIMFVVFLGLAPFLGMIPFYVYDGRTNAGGAVKMAWQDVKPHFWPVFGAMLLVGLMCGALGFVTFGLGAFLAPPLQTLAYVFMYRWISAHRDQPNQAGPQNPESPSGYMSMY